MIDCEPRREARVFLAKGGAILGAYSLLAKPRRGPIKFDIRMTWPLGKWARE